MLLLAAVERLNWFVMTAALDVQKNPGAPSIAHIIEPKEILDATVSMQ